ncbi:MAG TPA: copper chaperone [Porphyromonadaceae bacterium]|nr:copper chaperone [Porphyromonadaceae bacterium]
MKTKILVTFALSGLLFISCNSGTSKEKKTENEHIEMTPGTVNEEHAMLGVKGSCEMCKDRIEKAAKSVEDVTFASWDMEKQELHLNFDPDKTSIEAISKAIAAAGHDTDKDKAPDEVYNALPACCKYREP